MALGVVEEEDEAATHRLRLSVILIAPHTHTHTRTEAQDIVASIFFFICEFPEAALVGYFGICGSRPSQRCRFAVRRTFEGVRRWKRKKC